MVEAVASVVETATEAEMATVPTTEVAELKQRTNATTATEWVIGPENAQKHHSSSKDRVVVVEEAATEVDKAFID